MLFAFRCGTMVTAGLLSVHSVWGALGMALEWLYLRIFIKKCLKMGNGTCYFWPHSDQALCKVCQGSSSLCVRVKQSQNLVLLNRYRKIG